MEALAEKAGISRATVFNRFGSKLGVLEALVDAASPVRRCGHQKRSSWTPVAALEAMIEPSCATLGGRGFIVEQLYRSSSWSPAPRL